MVTPRIKQTSLFSQIYRMNANGLKIRAGSTQFSSGGTIHNVTGGFYHGKFDYYSYDNDVAVLRVCTDWDIAIDI